MRRFERRAALGWCAAALVAMTRVGADQLPAGKVAPKWSGKTVSGAAIKSDQFKGKVVLLNFFSFY